MYEPDEILDLCGEVCPMTFVYTKVKIEEMTPGQILKVIFDYPPSLKNVSKSIIRQKLGEILSKVEKNDQYYLWVKVIEKKG